jgi:AcrR family transcriptional regulator
MAPRSEEQFEEIREARKAEILEAAFELFATEGYHGASVSKIAKQAGISKGLMYNYFNSKEDVLRAVMRDIMDQVTNRFDVESIEKLEEKDVFNWVDLSFDVVSEDPVKWRLYTSLSTQPEVTPILIEEASGNIGSFVTKLQDFLKGKKVKDPMFWVSQIAAYVDGVQMHILLSPEQFPIEKSKKAIKDLIKSLYS